MEREELQRRTNRKAVEAVVAVMQVQLDSLVEQEESTAVVAEAEVGRAVRIRQEQVVPVPTASAS